jgi:mRNA-degrading endonuclease RelE of RelBE toxin-antitoxin system
MNKDYPVIVKTYNLTLWYIKKLNSLPKNHRYTLGEKIQNTLLNLLLILSDTIYSREKKPLLQKANKEIEKLRLLTRLLKDLAILSTDNFRFISKSIDEIGQMVGGWMRSTNV